jgi:hypothetical protein
MTGAKLADLTNGATIDITKFPAFNVVAMTPEGVSRVKFTLQSGATTKAFTDSSAPFAMCAGNVCPELGIGAHVVTATAFPCRRRFCSGGAPVLASFTLSREPSVATVPGGVTTPVSMAPASAAPATGAPITAAPITAAPSAAPVTSAPIMTAAPSAAPVTSAPVTAASVTDAPVQAPILDDNTVKDRK